MTGFLRTAMFALAAANALYGNVLVACLCNVVAVCLASDEIDD